jgi:hypothetical protein
MSAYYSLLDTGADTGGMGGSIPHFYSSIVSFAVSGELSSREQKNFFRLAQLAITIPPTCESESAPLLSDIILCRYAALVV